MTDQPNTTPDAVTVLSDEFTSQTVGPHWAVPTGRIIRVANEIRQAAAAELLGDVDIENRPNIV